MSLNYNSFGGIAEITFKDGNMQKIEHWKWNLNDKKQGRTIWLILGRKYDLLPATNQPDTEKEKEWVNDNSDFL